MPILAKKKKTSFHFDLGRYVNKQNCGIWGTVNPQVYIEKPTHSKRVTAWCGFWSTGIIGHKWQLQFKGVSERQIFEKLFMAILFTHRGYTRNLVNGSHQRNIFPFDV